MCEGLYLMFHVWELQLCLPQSGCTAHIKCSGNKTVKQDIVCASLDHKVLELGEHVEICWPMYVVCEVLIFSCGSGDVSRQCNHLSLTLTVWLSSWAWLLLCTRQSLLCLGVLVWSSSSSLGSQDYSLVPVSANSLLEVLIPKGISGTPRVTQLEGGPKALPKGCMKKQPSCNIWPFLP